MWDPQLCAGGNRTAVLAMAAFQAPPPQQQARAADAGGVGGCGSIGGDGDSTSGEGRPENVSLLFSDNRGCAAHVVAPTAAGGAEAPAAAVVSWQPHDGR